MKLSGMREVKNTSLTARGRDVGIPFPIFVAVFTPRKVPWIEPFHFSLLLLRFSFQPPSLYSPPLV